jgi:hypothetical protein
MRENRLQVGIDFSKKRADVGVYDPEGDPLERHAAIDNTRVGYEEFKELVITLMESHEAEGLNVSGEATSYYWMPFFLQLAKDEELAKMGLHLYLLNPRWVKWYKKSFPPDHKTDDRDTFYIMDRTRTHTPSYEWEASAEWLPLRFYTRYRFHLVQCLTREKNYFQAYLFLINSAYTRHKPFNNIFGATGSKILEQQDRLDEWTEMDVYELAEHLAELSGHSLRNPFSSARLLKQGAAERFQLDQTLSFAVQRVLDLTLQSIHFLQGQLKQIDTDIASARSRDIIGNDKMREMRHIKSSTNPFGQLVSGQFSGRFKHSAFSMQPHRLNGVQPGAFLGKQTDKNTDTLILSGFFVMSGNPLLGHLADMPGSMIPKHDQHFFAYCLKFLTDPFHELDGQVAVWVTFNKTQPYFLLDLIWCSCPSYQQSKTGQRFWVRILFIVGFLKQTQRAPSIFPCVQIGLCKTAPPGFILKSPNPIRVPNQGFDQPVSTFFLRIYSGSGLVIQCFARDHLTPSRFKVFRMVSSLTRSLIKPFSKLTSAAKSSVQQLVSFPKSRGLWWSISLSFAAVFVENAAWILWGRLDPISNISNPLALNPLITFCTVSSLHPKFWAIAGARSPRALANTIWQRLSTKPSCERNPFWSCSRSVSVSSRTNIIRGITYIIPHTRLSCLVLH